MSDLNAQLAGAQSNSVWPVIATQTHATATATQGAPSVKGSQHFVTGWTFSYSGGTPAVGTIQLLDGATVIDQIEIPALTIGPIICEYVKGYLITKGDACSLTCGDLGSGIKVTLVLRGRTIAG